MWSLSGRLEPSGTRSATVPPPILVDVAVGLGRRFNRGTCIHTSRDDAFFVSCVPVSTRCIDGRELR